MTYLGVIQCEPISSLLSRFEYIKEEPTSYKELDNGKDDVIYVPDEENIITDADMGVTYVNNMIMIVFNGNASQSDIDAVIDSINGTVIGRIWSVNQYQICINECSLNELRKIVSEVERYDCVLFAHYDQVYENLNNSVAPNDPWNNDGDSSDWQDSDVDGSNWWAEAIEAPAAWEYNEQFSKIKIGIVDNGFDTGHEDLTVTFPENYRRINSKEDHGTHVAGIIGATPNNGKGITGIVWNCELICFDWQATWLQDILYDWKTDTMIYAGLITTVKSGAKVVNFSIGSAGDYPNGKKYIQSVIDDEGKTASGYVAVLLKDYDFVVVQSAGNGGVDAINAGMFCSITYDNCADWGKGRASKQNILDRLLIVASAQQSEEGYVVSYFSDSGSQVNICAPGGDGSGSPSGDIYSTVTGGFSGKYKAKAGTSMAAPIVTGVASLVWSVNEDFSGTDVTDIVCHSTNVSVADNPISTETSGVHPMVNAKLAVEEAINRRNSKPTVTTSDERDIVLVLDVSGSMAGTPMKETKKASTNFVETILEEDASIGIVTYDNSANQASDFSVNRDSLENVVAGISDGGGTNIEAGLLEANTMLSSSNAKKKIIVLMSDGEPNDGKEGDDLVTYANEIKDSGVIIYTLGFFEDMGDTKSSAQVLMEQIASDGCHYEVANADDLVFFFGDIADQLNGQKYIYVRIACPVDVSVTYEGQTLNSNENDLSLRTDFGTLTFEENEEAKMNGIDDRVKILRLKEGAEYDLKIAGTGHGLMDYTIGFMDDEGNYSDLRKFEDIKITKKTVIDTVAETSKESTLKIDENGDGKYDLKLRAKENGYGKEIKQDYLIYIAVGCCVVLSFAVACVGYKVRNKKKGKVK